LTDLPQPGRKLISLVVPAFNEEENIVALYEAVQAALQPLADRYDFELVFTDNHSSDGTFEKIAALAARDPRVRAYRFSRNFGHQRSILAGYLRTRGAAAIQLDCDLQDPPELIGEFLRLWEEGHMVVYGVRRSRQEGRLMSLARAAYYRLVDWLSDEKLPHDAGDFRLIDRTIIEALRTFHDAQPYLRGTIAGMGYRQVSVAYDRPARQKGISKFSLGELMRLAMDGIVNNSIVPLRLATYTGLVMSVIALLAMVYYTAGRFLFGQQWPPGFATITVLLLLSLGLNSLFLGIIGEYMGRIYQQVRRQPLVLIERTLNAQEQAPSVDALREPPPC
jgi:polyisoprenyl-phosphate glycosyltransferase